jgi:hypothetical protein
MEDLGEVPTDDSLEESVLDQESRETTCATYNEENYRLQVDVLHWLKFLLRTVIIMPQGLGLLELLNLMFDFPHAGISL